MWILLPLWHSSSDVFIVYLQTAGYFSQLSFSFGPLGIIHKFNFDLWQVPVPRDSLCDQTAAGKASLFVQQCQLNGALRYKMFLFVYKKKEKKTTC